MPIRDQQVIGAAYPAIKPDLKRLCSTHGVEAAWVDECEDCEQLLGRVRDECERLLGDDESDAAGRRRLRDLIRFSTLAASLQQRTASSVATRRRLEELERENRELRSVTLGGDPTQSLLAEARRDERMAEMFRTLSSLSHHINNPLTTLIGRAQLLRLTGASDEATTKALRVIEESAGRVAGYVRELAQVVKESRERELSPDEPRS